MTSDTLKIICDSVVGKLYNDKKLFEYVRESSEEVKKSQRIQKNAILALEFEVLVNVHVAKCVYKHDTFFLARASSDAVFVLTLVGQSFRLHSGLYNINFNTGKNYKKLK